MDRWITFLRNWIRIWKLFLSFVHSYAAKHAFCILVLLRPWFSKEYRWFDSGKEFDNFAIRKLTCAEDKRTVSRASGSTAIGILVACFILFLLCDITTLYNMFSWFNKNAHEQFALVRVIVRGKFTVWHLFPFHQFNYKDVISGGCAPRPKMLSDGDNYICTCVIRYVTTLLFQSEVRN